MSKSIEYVLNEIIQIADSKALETRKHIDSLSIHSITLSSNEYIRELKKIKSYMTEGSAQYQEDIAKSKVLSGWTPKEIDTLIKAIKDSKVDDAVVSRTTFGNINTRAAKFKDSMLQSVASETDKTKYRALLAKMELGHESSSAMTEKLKTDMAKLLKLRSELELDKTTSREAINIVNKTIYSYRVALVASTTVDKSKQENIGKSADLNTVLGFFQKKMPKYLSAAATRAFEETYASTYIDITTIKNTSESSKNLETITLSVENWWDNSTKGDFARSIQEVNLHIIKLAQSIGATEVTKGKLQKLFKKNSASVLAKLSRLVTRQNEQVRILATEIATTTAGNMSASPTLTEALTTKIVDMLLGKPQRKLVTKKVVKKKGLISKTEKGLLDSIATRVQKFKRTPIVVSKPISLASLRSRTGTFQSVVNLQGLLSARLQEVIRKNMAPPALTYQTGRFAESIKLNSVQFDNRQNALTAFLSYMKYPYATFEPGGNQGNIDRSPSALIDRSVREIAAQLTKSRMRTIIV